VIEPVKLVTIPNDQYSNYRYEAIFNAYKWDPQVNDVNTVSQNVVVLSIETAMKLEKWAEDLSIETMLMEEALLNEPKLYNELGLPRGIKKALKTSKAYKREDHVRLMRFDFHPTVDGWSVSEVNSDVPGGFAEASILPKIAAKYFNNHIQYGDVAKSLAEAFKSHIKSSGTIAFVHATSYSDDRQVMQFASDYFNEFGIKTIMAAPDHIRWKNNEAYCILEEQEGKIDGIMRFFPLEWLNTLPRLSKWQGYYSSTTPSCNHPVSIFTQSKRLPIVWDKLGTPNQTWKMLLPETKDPKEVSLKEEGWIYKPALGRVGEGISIKEAVSKKELKKIEKSAHLFHKDWLAQRRFMSKPLQTQEGDQYHLCVGVFTVNGKFAGFYGRISTYPRIDANAKDIPILVSKEG
jgi:glutathionylspermidine synthase